jgi:hypothetical protein
MRLITVLNRCTKFKRFVLEGSHDEGPVGGTRCQHAVVPYQVQAWRWGQSGEAADELQRLEHQVRPLSQGVFRAKARAPLSCSIRCWTCSSVGGATATKVGWPLSGLALLV